MNGQDEQGVYPPPPVPGWPPTVPPDVYPPGPDHPPASPGVWPWFIVYCVVTALFCLCGCAVGTIFLVVDPVELEMDPVEAKIAGYMYIGISVFFFVPYIIAPFLPRRRWVWIYDLVLICLGMTSCCTLPACVALLIFWIKPNCRRFFGWD